MSEQQEVSRVGDDITRKPAVHCPRCHRLFNIPLQSVPGDQLSCPFCAAQMQLRERVVLVAEALETV